MAVEKMMKDLYMSDVYAMQRANGDFFALDDHGRLRVPLFHSIQDAMIGRLRNFGLLLFKPVALNACLFEEFVPVAGEGQVDFCIVNDPFASLNRGSRVKHAQLALLMRNPDEHQVRRNGNTFQVSGLSMLPQSDRDATETWEDEGGKYARGA